MQFLHWYRFYPSIWAVKFLCIECETHRFGSSIHSPPQIGVCLTDFPSTMPESVSCCMTWYTSCRWLAAPLIPCLPVCCSAQWDSLLGYMSTSSCLGVGLQGTCFQVCFLAAAQELWPLPHHEPQHADMSSAQDESILLSYSLEKKKHERMESFLNEVMQSYSQFCFARAWWFEKFVCIFLPACIKYSGKSSASSNIFLVVCCIWISVSEDCWFSGLLLSY